MITPIASAGGAAFSKALRLESGHKTRWLPHMYRRPAEAE